jgi:excisionase family DNA binding protein
LEAVKELMTVPEMCEVLRVSTDIGYGLVHQGAVPAVRLGRQIRVPRAALLQLLEQSAMANVTIDGNADKAVVKQ